MSNFDGSFMGTTSFWAPPSSPSPRTILMMLNQTDNGLTPINEMFPQANLSRDHNDRSEHRPGLGQRLASRIGFNPLTLETENISPFSAFFRNSIVPSPVSLTSPGFSPSTLLQSPMFSNSSQIIPPHLNTNDRPPAMVESFNEGNAETLIFNNNRPHHQEDFCDIPTEESVYIPSHETQVEPFEAPLVNPFEAEVVGNVNNDLTHQPMNVDVSPQEGFNEIPAEESVNISSHESHVEPHGAPLESDVDIISIEGESKNEEEDDDQETIAVKELDVGSSSSKRRKLEGSNMIGATRRNKTQRVIIQMECEEENPDDGFRWRKYGQKVVKRNPNPRSYFKCTYIGCKVKKHVERGADDAKILVVTYDGIHEHHAPSSRIRDKPCSMTQSDSSMSENHFNQNISQLSGHLSSLGSQSTYDARCYPTGLSMLPSLPVNHQNSGLMYRNEEPMVDVIPDGTRVFNGIIDQLYANFGVRF